MIESQFKEGGFVAWLSGYGGNLTKYKILTVLKNGKFTLSGHPGKQFKPTSANTAEMVGKRDKGFYRPRVELWTPKHTSLLYDQQMRYEFSVKLAGLNNVWRLSVGVPTAADIAMLEQVIVSIEALGKKGA